MKRKFENGESQTMARNSSTIIRPSGAWEVANGLKHRAEMPLFYDAAHVFRKSSIIATIGPNTNSPEALRDLRNEGMNIVRMNFSHGSHEYHGSVIDNLAKSFELQPGPCVAVALDTKGPEIRTGMMKDDGEIQLVQGAEITVTTDPAFMDIGSPECIYVDYTNLPKVVNVGSCIFIDDGLISLKVLGKSADSVSVKCQVVNSGAIASRRGVNLPGTIVDLPALSVKDKTDLQFAVEKNCDMIFASFIRKAQDVRDIRKELGEKGKRVMIISKIESQEGVDNFDDILTETDGVMVARGDLGIEIPLEKVFVAQKMMIAKCNIAGKPCICATQMLESMIVNPRPTRAEVSDVANAVLDGADCVMLSGETAKGKYPCEAVSVMNKICIQAEQVLHYKDYFQNISEECMLTDVSETIAACAASSAAKCDASAIIVLTSSGNTARLVAKYRPRCPILVVTQNTQTARQCHLYRGCTALHYEGATRPDWHNDREARVQWGIKEGKQRYFLKNGDKVIVVLGYQKGHGKPNSFRVVEVGSDEESKSD